MELVTDVDSAVQFIAGIVPAGLADDAAKVTRADLAVVPDSSETEEIDRVLEVLSRDKFMEMSKEEYLRDWAPRIQRGEVVLGE
jgi:hypothetical protein